MSNQSQQFSLSPVLESIDDNIVKVNGQSQIIFKNEKAKTGLNIFSGPNITSKIYSPQFSSEEESEFSYEEEASEESGSDGEKKSEKFKGDDGDYDVTSTISRSIGNLHLMDDHKSTASDTKSFRGRPSSCVFVASLASSMSDDHLCVSVTTHFEKWGSLATVKVLRDPSNRPYAFVQYTNDRDAQRAIAEGQHSILDGRTIRCEAARVNRTLYISTSSDIIEEDVRERLETFGEIEQLVNNEYGDYNNYRTGGGRFSNFNKKASSKAWFCKFAYRDNAIRAYANLRANPEWIVEWAQNLDPPPFEAKEEVTIDRYSVFVGQLYAAVTKDELVKRFESHGTVVEAILVTRPNNNFAFIKYDSEAAAAAAVERENHSIFEDKTMHVQYREIHHHHYNNNNNRRSSEPRLAPPPINLSSRRSSTGSSSLTFRMKPVHASEHPITRVSSGFPAHSHANPGFGIMSQHGPTISFHQQNMKRNEQFSTNDLMIAGKYGPSYADRGNFRDQFKYGNLNDDGQKQFGSRYSTYKSKKNINSNKGSDDESISDIKPLKNEGSTHTPIKYSNRKDNSPAPSSSHRTSNSPTISKSVYSPSSAINSEQFEDQFNPTLKHERRAPVPTLPSNSSVPYFYYVPSKEAYEGMPAGNIPGYYYNPYQFYPPTYDHGSEFSQPGMAPYYMYYPNMPMSQNGSHNGDPMMMARNQVIPPVAEALNENLVAESS